MKLQFSSNAFVLLYHRSGWHKFDTNCAQIHGVSLFHGNIIAFDSSSNTNIIATWHGGLFCQKEQMKCKTLTNDYATFDLNIKFYCAKCRKVFLSRRMTRNNRRWSVQCEVDRIISVFRFVRSLAMWIQSVNCGSSETFLGRRSHEAFLQLLVSYYRPFTHYDEKLCFYSCVSVKLSWGGVFHLHSIILPLVPCPFHGVPHLHPIILPLLLCPFWGYMPSPSHNTFTGLMSFPGWDTPHTGQGGVPPCHPPLGQVMLGQVTPWAVRLLRFQSRGLSCLFYFLVCCHYNKTSFERHLYWAYCALCVTRTRVRITHTHTHIHTHTHARARTHTQTHTMSNQVHIINSRSGNSNNTITSSTVHSYLVIFARKYIKIEDRRPQLLRD